MNRFKQARDRGGAWLLKKQQSDGSIGHVADYYKVISALQVCGESNAANRLCAWIRTNGIMPDGDFGPRPEEANGYYYAYFNTWVVIGAQRLGQFDLAEAGMDFLMGFWDAESGGFYSSLTERTPETKQDLWVVSGCGQAALYTGRTDVARGVGRWMRRMMEAQPNYPSQMHTVYSRTKGLYIEPDPDDDIRYVLNNDATRDQFFFHPGIAGGFLARLYQATGENEWLELAKEYMLFAEGANDYLLRLLRAGKVGWAASVLYTLTEEDKYKEMAIRVGDNLVATQSEEGSWMAMGTNTPNIDTTAEMVVWLDEIYQAVGNE